jgi:CHASE3 domain sensor protein
MADNLGLMLLLLLVRHHVKVLETLITHELEELGRMVKLAAQAGQTPIVRLIVNNDDGRNSHFDSPG